MRRVTITYLFLACFIVSASSYGARKKNRRPTSMAEKELLQRIYSIEDHRILKDRILNSALRHPSPKIYRTAILAVGRIHDVSMVEDLARFLSKKDPEAKKLAAFALGLMTDPIGQKILQQNLILQKDPEVQARILLSLSFNGGESMVNQLASAITDSAHSSILEAAAQGLGILWSQDSEKWSVPVDVLPKLVKLCQGRDPIARASAFAIARFKGDQSLIPVNDLIAAATKTQSLVARAFLIRAIGKNKSQTSAAFLANELSLQTKISLRIEAVKALAAQPFSDPIFAAIKKALTDSSNPLVNQTLETLQGRGPDSGSLTEVIEATFRNSLSIWIKGSALKALVAVNPTVGRPRINDCLNIPSSPLLVPAVTALGIAGQPEDIERLSTYVVHEDPKVASAAIEALNFLSEEKISASVKVNLRKTIEKADVGTTSLAAGLIEKYKWKEFAGSLATSYRLFQEPDQIEGKIAVLNALAAVGDASHLELFESAMNDNDRLVIVAAANAIKATTGKDVSEKIPVNSKISAFTPTLYEMQSAEKSRIILRTSRGEIQMRMLPDSPITAAQIVRLVKKDFYQGKTFHRIVPNFVAQGGDPRGDGYGGPGFLIRDEVTWKVHERGTVGIATAGPDTGGCQFFVNLSPNLHLTGKYTLFAEVISGMEVADRLEAGDRILSVRVKE